jgi:uncharacterized protein with von Willebrand factor type A (vWA) domain
MNNDPSNNVSPDGQTPNSETPNGQTPNPQMQTPSGSQQTPISSLPQDVQDYIKRLRDEAEDANKQKKAEARAKQQAEEARLQEQGQYKELAAQHAARVQELEPIVERFTALSTLVAEQITAETKDWPAELKTFDPGLAAPVEQRLEWVKKSRPLIEKLQSQARTTSPGNSPSPRPVSQQQQGAQDVDELRSRYRASGKYAF